MMQWLTCYPHPLIKFLHNRAMHRPLPHLLYNSESEPDSDNEMDPDLHWRKVQDIPSLWLMRIMRDSSQQPVLTENNSPLSLQNATSPPNISDNHDRDGM